jgi:hypothetical protein
LSDKCLILCNTPVHPTRPHICKFAWPDFPSASQFHLADSNIRIFGSSIKTSHERKKPKIPSRLQRKTGSHDWQSGSEALIKTGIFLCVPLAAYTRKFYKAA